MNRASKSPQESSSATSGTAKNSQATGSAISMSASALALAPANRSFSAITGGKSNGNGNAATGINGGSGAGTLRGRAQIQEAPAGSALAESRGLIEGEEPGQVEAMHQRLLFIMSFLVGSQVKVETRGGQSYVGVLDSINPNDAQSVVLRYAYVQDSSRATPPVDTLVVTGSDCLSISGAAAFAEHSVKESSRTGFKTDADISRMGSQIAARELHRWVPDESVELGGLESGLDHPAAGSQSWDQFATNEQLFGLTTDFDEEIYTTKLDRTRADYKEREREAIRIAQEIQSTPFANSHVAEERQEVAGDDSGVMDEEDRYGAVLRPSGAPGKYVPPYLRGKADAAPAAKQPALSKAESTENTEAPQSQSQRSSTSPAASAAQANASAAPNNAVAAAALAKLNIVMTGHSSLQKPSDAAATATTTTTITATATVIAPGTSASASSNAASPSLAGDPAITALSKPSNIGSGGKLANLRGLKHRTDAAALNKPMADITEKLNSERERIQQHKMALRQTRMSELKEFQKSFKLHTPMPEDLAEIIGVKKKQSLQRSDSESSTSSGNTAPSSEGRRKGGTPESNLKLNSARMSEPALTPAAPAAAQPQAPESVTAAKLASPAAKAVSLLAAAPTTATAMPVPAPAPSSPPKKPDTLPSEKPKLTLTPMPAPAPKQLQPQSQQPDAEGSDKKATASFKFNAKASSFKPSAAAPPF
ncbi:poly(A)-binding protein binding protein, partial [Kickxella alabastrina]